MRTGLLAILLAVTGAAVPPPDSVIETVKVSDRVYAFIGPDPTRDIVVGNAVAVIGDDGVLLVDTTNAPSNARVILAELRKVTDKPVRYIVHTHWHYDHIMGDSVFAEAFAPLDVVVHARTRPVLDEKIPAWPKRATEVYTRIAGQYRKELADGKDESGKPLGDYDRDRHRQTLGDVERYLPEIAAMSYVRPTITFEESMTLHLGALEVRLLYFGRGNTDGDVAVYIPQERVLATGDLLVHPVPYAFNAHLEEWARGLGRMAELDVATIVPGHGPVFADKEYLLSVKQLLESVLAQARGAKQKGLTLEEAQRTIELEPYRKRFAGDDPSRNDAWVGYFRNPAVASVYAE
jgi:cyclase